MNNEKRPTEFLSSAILANFKKGEIFIIPEPDIQVELFQKVLKLSFWASTPTVAVRTKTFNEIFWKISNKYLLEGFKLIRVVVSSVQSF
jgi:hypothetical protein